MKTEIDFPPPSDAEVRATAWALDQLDSAERAVFEQEMDNSPELAVYAHEMRGFCATVGAELPRMEASAGLDGRRETVVAALSQAPAPVIQGNFIQRHWKGLSLTAAAACLALGLRPLWMENPSSIPAAEIAASMGTESLFLPGGGGGTGADASSKGSKSMRGDVSKSGRQSALDQEGKELGRLDGMSMNNPVLAEAEATELSEEARPLLAAAEPQSIVKEENVLEKVRAAEMSRAAMPQRSRNDLLSAGAKAKAPIPSTSLSTLAAAPATAWADGLSRGGTDSYAMESKFEGMSVAAEGRSETESYQGLPSNGFHEVTAAPLSTFSIDVDTASYANVRRFLNAGSAPPSEAVRLEELVNYFPYDEAGPQDGKPFAVRVDMASAPWNARHRLARVVLKGKDIDSDRRPPGNLVFLVDVSGSMNEPNKLPLVQQSLRLLTERLTENDRVSIVTYAGTSQLVLPSTNGQNKKQILAAIDSLSSGGGTNGAGGIGMAYEQAAANFIQGGANRVILATDGDFNIGVTSNDDLLALITEKAKSGVFLSILGYGMGNLKDDRMEMLSDKGNGNYAYIDSLSEARKALVEQMSGTLVTIAKDVKIQIEFNPSVVKSYRLLGYENRLLAKEDFNNDKKDAGEIGAGHTVTALYEIVPAGLPGVPVNKSVDGLKYQQTAAVIAPKPEATPAAASGEMMTVKLRWKQPQTDTSELLEIPVKDNGADLAQANGETRWAAAVAGFAQLLRGENPNGTLTWESVRQLARGSKGPDPLGYRGEFLQLIDKAESLAH